MTRIRLQFNVHRPHAKLFLWPLVVMAVAAWTGADAQTETSRCGTLANHFGPYDYRKHAGTVDFKANPLNPLRLVESAHLLPETLALIRGNHGNLVGDDLDYTLRAFPNDHKALDAITRLAEKLKTDQPPGARLEVDCYFDRAIRFTPDDAIVRMLYAAYLNKRKRLPEAMKQLEIAASSAKEDGFTQYNVGLVYLDLGEYERALAQAHIAYGMGMQHPELRDMLKSSGHWREPATLPPPSDPASTPAATQ